HELPGVDSLKKIIFFPEGRIFCFKCGSSTDVYEDLWNFPRGYRVEGYFEFRLPDSREGGVEALKLSLEPYFLGKQIPKYDFSLILPAGVPIRGFGGIASGPES
ncbi:unnamed protein product, partial [marine sediment metagenome]